MTHDSTPGHDDRTNIDRGLGVVLQDAPAGYKIDRTFLIDIIDPSPAHIEARMQYHDASLADDKILDAYKDTRGWGPITHPKPGSPPENVKTRLDLDVSKDGHDQYALVVFKLSSGDSFIADDDSPRYAITGALGGRDESPKCLFAPAWISNGTATRTIVRMIAGKGDYKTLFNLGIVVTDSCDATHQTPIFLDPKIEDSGGR